MAKEMEGIAEERRRVALENIEKHGVAYIKERVFTAFQEMIEKSKLSQSLGDKNFFLMNVGFEHVPYLDYLVYIECLLQMMPEGKEKEEIREAYDYWVANEDDILTDNRIERPVA